MNPDEQLSNALRLDEPHEKALDRLGLETVRDLLYHFPSRYVTVANVKHIEELEEGDHALIYGKITDLETKKSYRKGIPMATGTLEDDTGQIETVWFNQPYIAKMLKDDQTIKVEGKVGKRNGKLYISNPEYEKVKEIPFKVGASLFSQDSDTEIFSIPVYPETKGVTSKWLYHSVKKILSSGALEELYDPIPEYIRDEYNLPNIATALIWMHAPKKEHHILAAKKRFAFEEVFFIQLYKQQERKRYEAHESFIINKSMRDIGDFIDRFGFTPTDAQTNAIKEILSDFSSPHAMSRLLEGDVGSGKTAVAAATSYAVVTTTPKGRSFGNLQVAYMAPTEILAKQHFQSFIDYFSHVSVNIGLITSSGCKKFPSKVSPEGATDISRRQLLKWVEEARMPILIGTHSLIQKSVTFSDLAYVIIDEQHRFGVNQRAKLKKNHSSNSQQNDPLPHLLSMTATPIPRTLALTLYGDLDITLLNELPPGRTYPETELVPENKREEVEQKIREKLQSGRQAYVVCPRIHEPDPQKEHALDTKSVDGETKRLKKVFSSFTVEKMHGQMKPSKKEKVMEQFNNGDIDVLVATSVIEVGVNVPNATTIVIENAERFGLAQLHQLRGRVMRSAYPPHCYLFADSSSDKTRERLNALQEAKNGFELAEYDLSLRGPGALTGTRQSGISDIAMEALKNIHMVEKARDAAHEIIENDPTLENFPTLAALLAKCKKRLHLE